MSTADIKQRLEDANRTGDIAVFTLGETIPADWIRELARGKDGHFKGLRIDGATIRGKLDFEDCTLERPLFLFSCTIAEGIILHRARVQLLGFMSCPEIGCIEGDSLHVESALFLRGSTVRGRFFLVCGKVGGNLDCAGATLDGGDGNALDGDGLEVTGSLFLGGLSAKGSIRLPGAKVRGDISLIGATLGGANGNALKADGLEVSGGLLLWGGFSAKGCLDLNHAKVGVLVDQAECWPAKGDLILTGFTYDSLGPESPQTAAQRLDWLGRRRDFGRFDPQPYEQLAKVLKASGHAGEARQILIEKERDYARRKRRAANAPLQWLHVGWLWLMDKLTRHGYEPWRVLPFLAFFWCLGWGVYADADRHHAMVPAKERVYMSKDYQDGKLPPQYPRLNAFIYSADVFFPFVDLHQEGEWRPATEKVHSAQTEFDVSIGAIAKVYTWIHIALGWFLSAIGVAAVTGLIKRE